MKALVQEEDDFALRMTPMIDIVFQLLIFFLLATSIKEEELDIQVNLPSTDTGAQRASAAGTRRFINVRKDSSVTLGGAPIAWDDLKKKLDEDGKAKQKLADEAFPRMTPALLMERDPDGEVAGWLTKIGALLQ